MFRPYSITSESGFTLIELLTNMLILLILAGIVYGSFHEYKKRAYDAQALAANRNFYTASLSRVSDVDDLLGSSCPPYLNEQHIHQPGGSLSTSENDLPNDDYIVKHFKPGADVNYHTSIISNPLIGLTIFVYTYSCKGSTTYMTTRMTKWCSPGSMDFNLETPYVKVPLNPVLCG